MSQLRLDPLTGRWVAVAKERTARPDAFARRLLPVEFDTTRPCPFCPGHEESTPPALVTYSQSGEWTVRVVPNLYPAFSGLDPLVVSHRGPVFTEAPASGIHEVLVLTPEHRGSWADVDDDQVGVIMRAMRDRIRTHAESPSLRYSQAIVNCGREAGASIEHPHGQLLGMSFVPRELVDEQGGFSRFAGGCVLCATLEAEECLHHRLVAASDDAVVVCPFWSGTPYEMLVIPRHHERHLHVADDDALVGTGLLVRDALVTLRRRLGDIAYNLVFHSAPYRAHGPYHWHVHILPKLVTQAGFELGTGVPIVMVPPEDAAADLKEVASSAA
jgi:UDPglucose--hexose-1-phosphate uridylyltransferase